MILRSRLLGWLNTWLNMVLIVQSANSAIHWQKEAACISHVANANTSSVVAVAKPLLWEPNALWDHTVPSWACMLTTHVTASFTWGIRNLHNCRNYFRYKITKFCTTRTNRYLQNMSKEQTDHLSNILHQCLENTKSMDIPVICGLKSQTATMLLVSSIPTCTGVTTFRISFFYLLVIWMLYTHGLYHCLVDRSIILTSARWITGVSSQVRCLDLTTRNTICCQVIYRSTVFQCYKHDSDNREVMSTDKTFSNFCLLKSSLEFIYGTLFLLFHVAYVSQNSSTDDYACTYTKKSAGCVHSSCWQNYCPWPTY